MGIAERLNTTLPISFITVITIALKEKLLSWDIRDLHSSDQRIYKFLSEKWRERKGMKSGEGRESSRFLESSNFGQQFSLPVHQLPKNNQQ